MLLIIFCKNNKELQMMFQKNAKKIFGSPLENHLHNNRTFNVSMQV